MKHIRVLGLGNSRHRQLTHNLENVVREMELAVDVEQVMEVDKIISSGVGSIPAILLNGNVIFDGKVNPTRAELKAAIKRSLRQTH